MSGQVDSGAVTLAEPLQEKKANSGRPTVTVVIPVYFAEATIGRLVEAADAAQSGTAVQSGVVPSLSTTPFLVPGLVVRLVRLAGDAGRAAGSVIVTQELEDGRAIELQCIGGVVGGSLRERNDLIGPSGRAGWNMVARNVAGGLAVLSGPLTEPELSELLDRALGPR